MSVMRVAVEGRLAGGVLLGRLMQRLRADGGATAVEYALMVGLIAVVIIAAVTLLGGNVSNKLNSAASALT